MRRLVKCPRCGGVATHNQWCDSPLDAERRRANREDLILGVVLGVVFVGVLVWVSWWLG